MRQIKNNQEKKRNFQSYNNININSFINLPKKRNESLLTLISILLLINWHPVCFNYGAHDFYLKSCFRFNLDACKFSDIYFFAIQYYFISLFNKILRLITES